MITDFARACIADSTENYQRALNDVNEYMDFLIARSEWKEESPEGWLPSTTYYAVENNEILGAIRVRRGRNKIADKLIGYIGFETKPSARRRGIATRLLAWVAANVLTADTIITCEESNSASKKVLEKFGATYLDKSHDENSQTNYLRYKLQIKGVRTV
ncbi:MAG: GNAT family N-acetyltransferase [Pseudohongiellaceae bacterium]|nr:GNAT family N-acetyltransferase [Pseudohongiellaceae bacterium]